MEPFAWVSLAMPTLDRKARARVLAPLAIR
jgi:hypothetical protein